MDSGVEDGKPSLPSKATRLAANLTINVHRIRVFSMGARYTIFLDVALERYRAHRFQGLIGSYGFCLLLFKVSP